MPRVLRPSRRLPAYAGVLVAGLIAGCAGGTDRAVDDGSGGTRFLVGDGTGTFFEPGDRPSAPVLAGRSIDGDPLSTAAFAGEVLVLNVWGSWCAPCKKEQPDLERAWRDTRGLGVRFLGINVRDNSPVAAQRHVARYGVTYESFYDPRYELVTRFRDVPPQAIPTTLVVDRRGGVAARVFGALDYAGLVELVRRVAAEPA